MSVVTLNRGETLTVVGAGSITNAHGQAHTVAAGVPMTIGTPGKYTLDDGLAFTIAPLRDWQLTKSQGISMALGDKFKTLAVRMRDMPRELEARADALDARMNAVQERGDKAFSGHERFMDGIESGVAAAEDALNQLTNGAPLD